MEPSNKPNPTAQTGHLSVKFAFEKSPLYRSIHADGAWGRLDAYANIHMTIFNEKPQLIASGVMRAGADGRWEFDETKTQYAHDAPLVREVECDVIMNVPAAIVVRDMLNNFIKLAIEHMQKANQQAVEMERQNK